MADHDRRHGRCLSPWVRAAAAETAGEHLSPDAVGAALLKATRNPVRLPRVRAANALASLPASAVPTWCSRWASRPQPASWRRRSLRGPMTSPSTTTLAGCTQARGDRSRAIAAYDDGHPAASGHGGAALVNVSLAYNADSNSDAESALRRALALEPGSAAAHLNLGMLLAELGRLPEAERQGAGSVQGGSQVSCGQPTTWRSLFSRDRLDQAVTWSRLASELDPASRSTPTRWPSTLPSAETSRQPSPCFAGPSTGRRRAPKATPCWASSWRKLAIQPRPRRSAGELLPTRDSARPMARHRAPRERRSPPGRRSTLS